MAKLSIYKYVRTDKGWRYCKAAFHPNGKIKPDVVVVSGIEEKHDEGRYFLNFNNRWIDVGENALEAQRKRLLRLNQMKAGTRNIPISDSLLSELLALPKGRPPKGVDAGLLFPNEDGNVNGHLLREIQKATKESGVPKVKLHGFRDTFITNKLRDGVDVRTVQRWAGHEDVNITMGYAAWLDGQSKAARDAANREDTRYRKTGTQGD